MRSILPLIAFTLLSGLSVAELHPHRLREQVLNGVTEIYFENPTGTDVTVTFEITGMENGDLQGWPAKSVKACPKGDSVRVGTIFAVVPSQPVRYTHTISLTTGISKPKARVAPRPPGFRVSSDTATNRPKKAPQPASPAATWVKPAPTEPFDPNYNYRLPFATGRGFLCSQGYNGKVTHQGDYALDFAMPVGTPVHAARGGLVTQAHDGEADQRGNQLGKNRRGNGVQVLHDDGTAASYHHLKHNGVVVKEFTRVNRGDLLGYSGNTGESGAPHLHFSVSKPGSASIPTVFEANGEKNVSIKEKVRYVADP